VLLGGVHSEFIHSAWLDNLVSCFLTVQALVEHVQDGSLAEDEDVSEVVLFDH
jgi:aspartyl aminopeptidase